MVVRGGGSAEHRKRACPAHYSVHRAAAARSVTKEPAHSHVRRAVEGDNGAGASKAGQRTLNGACQCVRVVQPNRRTKGPACMRGWLEEDAGGVQAARGIRRRGGGGG